MSFVTPEQRTRMIELLRGDEPETEVALLVGFYTVELRDAPVDLGIEVITCDYRLPESAGCTTREMCARSYTVGNGTTWWAAHRVRT